MIKLMALISNVFLVIGIISLFFLNLILAIIMFAISLAISLVIFNTMFRDRTGMKIVINVSFAIVLIAIIFAFMKLS
ncbi:hypothetical protein [Staphylococcus auricularis]|mgnify:CR=1 FL=1|uniref:Uncharacterized protein n=2 Tax=Staphylococcus auricularis TaxID=29379 RepID=A0AAP8TTD2_9STAP|nr:hypothetical protein [Staphylococcus auricularis]MBM0867344.1 hypothetical protein [Staphylococcus auricularis]PNZ68041.1 hypothetical protein CD158_04550 [Staphylococcus auricularis]PTH19378.1 hypothetical protein BU607_02175 [Staphylococcus auricularis]PTH26435.1 hypothetical protein BU608_04305 [Staphylococcus auricularis]